MKGNNNSSNDTPSILIIDDSITSRLWMRRCLTKDGYVLLDAENGEQGLELFRTYQPQLVILDVMMPKLDGFETCRQLRQLPSADQLPIMMITGSEESHAIDRAYEAGATDFIIKPLNESIFKQRVRYMLRASRALQRVQFFSHHDALTGLANRQRFRDRLRQALLWVEHGRYSLAVLYIDLDGFRRINATLGYALGDSLLHQIGLRLASIDGGLNDTTARMAGDEFAVLLCAPMERNELIERGVTKIREALTPPFALSGRDVFMTSSIGAALYPDDGGNADDLISNAHAALHDAKRLSKNIYRRYRRSMSARSERRLVLENKLHQALELPAQQGVLQLYYQPKYEMASARIIGVEALLRWYDSEQGWISPAEAIPLAEQCGLIGALGDWVFRAACLQLGIWREAGIAALRVAVNLSSLQFYQNDLLARIDAALSDTGVEPQGLELELTESTFMNDQENAARVLTTLKAKGTTIAIDDFGIGYSSLQYLKKLPIDSLKIDRSFIQDIGEQDDAEAIPRAIISMAHSLKLCVIAEGVETEAQYDTLYTLGCDQIQGLLFSRPLPAQQMTAFLRKKTSTKRSKPS